MAHFQQIASLLETLFLKPYGTAFQKSPCPTAAVSQPRCQTAGLALSGADCTALPAKQTIRPFTNRSIHHVITCNHATPACPAFPASTKHSRASKLPRRTVTRALSETRPAPTYGRAGRATAQTPQHTPTPDSSRPQAARSRVSAREAKWMPHCGLSRRGICRGLRQIRA